MKNFVILISFLVLANLSVQAQTSLTFIGNAKTVDHTPGMVTVHAENGSVRVELISKNIFRYRASQSGVFTEAVSYAIVNPPSGKPQYNFTEELESITLSTSRMKIIIAKNPVRVTVYDPQGNIMNQDEPAFGVTFDGKEVRSYKTLFDDESFFGLGEKAHNLGRRNNQYTLWNSDTPAYKFGADPLYVSTPFFIGVRGGSAYGIYFDNSYKSYFNFGASNNRFYWFGAEQGEMDYYYIAGPAIRDVVSTYTTMTGLMELPPMWALGFQQSRWSYYPESRVREIASEFRKRDIPCDVIYLDIHYMDGYRVFTWDKERFPDPQKLLADLKAQGFKVVTIIDPGVKADTNYAVAREGLAGDHFAKYPDGIPYQGEVWPSWSFFPDFTKKETRTWWGGYLGNLLKQGIAGFWNDMNEPAVWGQVFPDIVMFNDEGKISSHKKIHNVYALKMAEATKDAIYQHSNNRHLVVTRAGFSGIQRYSSVWTGDNVSSWDHLRLALYMPLSMGLTGMSFTGSDVGGFIGTPTPDLFTRWLQLGAFTPFYRAHAEINSPDKEPWTYGEKHEKLNREAIKLRYRILPHLYNELYQSSVSGLPVMRAMFLEYQSDPETMKEQAFDQFMFGDQVLVAPVLYENDVKKQVYFPKGKWYGLHSGEVITSNGELITVQAPLEEIPYFLKEGGFFVTREPQQYVGEKKADELEVTVFPAVRSSYTLYQDDGITREYQKGNFSLTRFTADYDADALILNVRKEKGEFQSEVKTYLLKIAHMDDKGSVQMNGKELVKSAIPADTKAGMYHYDHYHRQLLIRVPADQPVSIKIQ